MNESRVSFRYLMCVAIVAASMTACGGGDDGGTAPTPPPSPPPTSLLPPATGPGDTLNYAPNGPTDAWSYNASASDGTTPTPEHDISRVWVNGTATVLGQSVTVYSERLFSEPATAPTTDLYYRKGPGGVAYYGNNDPLDTLTAGVVPYAELLFPVQAGPIVSFTKTGVDFGDDLDGDGRNETVDATQTISIAGFEPITVPAGTFASAAKRNNTIVANARLSASGQVISITTTEHTWLAPGAGIVRRDMVATAAGLPVRITGAIEARGYTVGGMRKGLGDPLALVPASLGPIYPTNTLDPVALSSAPGVASSGSNALIVTKRFDPGLLQRIGHLRSPDGTLNSDFPIGPAVPYADTQEVQAVAYGGGTYLAVFEQRNPPPGGGSGSPYPSIVAQRIAPSGAVTDPVPFELLPASFGPQSATGISSRFPAVAYGGGVFLAVYVSNDLMSNNGRVEGRLIAPDGTVGPRFAISPDALYAGLAPRVVFDGTNFVVASADSGGWRLQRVTPGGTVIDPAGALTPLPAGAVVSLASGGAGSTLAAWIAPDDLVYARRFGADLASLDPAPLLVARGYVSSRYAITATALGGEYAVFWMQRASPMNYNSFALYMNRVSFNGTVQAQSTPMDAMPEAGPYAALVSATPPTSTSPYPTGYVFPAVGASADASFLAFIDSTSLTISTMPPYTAAVGGLWVHPFAR